MSVVGCVRRNNGPGVGAGERCCCCAAAASVAAREIILFSFEADKEGRDPDDAARDLNSEKKQQRAPAEA